jgi:hypothetical protein
MGFLRAHLRDSFLRIVRGRKLPEKFLRSHKKKTQDKIVQAPKPESAKLVVCVTNSAIIQQSIITYCRQPGACSGERKKCLLPSV